MFYVLSYSRGHLSAEHACQTRDISKQAFGKAVESASSRDVDRVIVEKRLFGHSTILEDWKANKGSACTKLEEYPTQYKVSFATDTSTGAVRFDTEGCARAFAASMQTDPGARFTRLSARVFAGMRRGSISCTLRPHYTVKQLDEWKPLTLTQQIDAAYGYKIHGFDTVIDPKISAKTAKWYKTEDQAMRAAKSMANSSSCARNDALVVYKVHAIVSRDGVENV